MNTAEVIKSCRTLPGITVTEGTDCVELRLSNGEGSGCMRFFPVFPGVMLALISVSAPFWPAPVLAEGTPDARGPLILNYCTYGRCELVLNDNRSVFLTSGHVSMTERFACGEYSYPGRSYEGIELFIDPEDAQNDPILYDYFGVDIQSLRRRYCSDGETFIAKAALPEELLNRLRSHGRTEHAERLIGMKTGVIDLLAHLQYRPAVPETARLVYYTRSQVEMVRHIESVISAELSVPHSAKEFALSCGISESSVKNYFRGVYGQSISQYTRQVRMARAAELLASSALPVSEIAAHVGYESQSKFSTAFRKKFGVSPLEYRRRNRLPK